MNKTGRWTYNDPGNEYWNNDDFETESEAIEAAFEDEQFVKDHNGKDGELYFLQIATGKIEQPTICDGIDLDEILVEAIREHHLDNYGEYGSDYLDNVSYEARKELNEAMTKLIEEWATRNNLQPDHYLIKEVKEKSYLVEDERALNWIKESEGE